MRIILTIGFNFLLLTSFAQRKKLIFKDDFKDSSRWIIEMAPAPNSSVYTDQGKLIMDTGGGVTVWLNQRLEGNIQIEYKRKVLTAGKVNDRLSDLNQFWMASDPRNKNLFTRTGILEQYDSLQLYYVGMGGNTNSTTRFRKYEGNGMRTLLQEYTDTAHLLKENSEYKITIIIKNGVSAYLVNDVPYFSYADPNPLKSGYFGFRSTWSRQEISHLRIYQLH
jgi:rhamnogalacturonan endolyase